MISSVRVLSGTLSKPGAMNPMLETASVCGLGLRVQGGMPEPNREAKTARNFQGLSLQPKILNLGPQGDVGWPLTAL